MSSHDDIRAIALAEFAASGYAGTSLQRIAEIAGLSKSSVLYHFSSKEALLEAALAPAIDAISAVLNRMGAAMESTSVRHAFIADFVDCMLVYRLEMHIFINHSRALVDIPVIDRANAAIQAINDYFLTQNLTLAQKMRFGIALGGAAYALAIGTSLGEQEEPTDELRAALIAIMTELLDPISVRPLSSVE